MHAKTSKTFLSYVLILAAGLGIGASVPHVVDALKSGYTTGDYSAYFPDQKSNVVLYGTASCPYCAQARAFLRERKIAFIDHDLSTSEKGRAEFALLGKDAVPVILVGERLLTGFNPGRLEAALVNAGHTARP